MDMINFIKDFAGQMNITPIGIAQKADVKINSMLAKMVKEEMQKDDSFKGGFFEIEQNVNDYTKEPNIVFYGIIKDDSNPQRNGIQLIKNLSFKNDLFDNIADAQTMSMLNMIKDGFDIESSLSDFFKGLNESFNVQHQEQGFPIRIMILVGAENMDIRFTNKKRKTYKKVLLSSFIDPKATF